MNKLIKFIFIVFLLNILNLSNSFADISKVDEITKNLLCLICQGQSIYDSNSDFALSVKTLVSEKLESGDTEKDIYNFLKSKYGDWIVYEPDLNFKTIFLWLIPLILFVFGGFLIFRKRFIN